MLVYANCEELLPKDTEITIEPNSILFTQEMDAELQAEIDELVDDEEGNKSKIYTYRIIIDEPIHDPLVDAQFSNVYYPDEDGYYPIWKRKQVDLEEFAKKVQDTHNSKALFWTTPRLTKMVSDFGFKAVYYFQAHTQRARVLEEFNGRIIGATRKGIKYDIEYK